MTAYLDAMHFWWPKITGRLYPDALAKLSVLLLYVGFNLTFFPQHILGWLGMPRRYHEYPAEFQVWHLLSTAGAGPGRARPPLAGAWGAAASLGIAAAKAALIVSVFMRLGRAGSLVRVAAGAGLFWLTILIVLTLADVLTRPS